MKKLLLLACLSLSSIYAMAEIRMEQDTTSCYHLDEISIIRYDEIPGLFGQMLPMDGAIEAVHRLNEYYDCYILSTAPWKNPSAWSDKVLWVTRYLDDVFHKRVVITHCKNLCKGDILIDDRGKNGTSEFEGEWIQFGSDRFPDWKSVLDHLLPNGE